jgi:hypothetical protein
MEDMEATDTQVIGHMAIIMQCGSMKIDPDRYESLVMMAVLP